MMKNCLIAEAARDTEWMKNAMSVSSLSLAQRGKQGTVGYCNKEKWNQYGKKNEMCVEIPRAFSPKAAQDGKSGSEFGSSIEKGSSFSKNIDIEKCQKVKKQTSLPNDVTTSGSISSSSGEIDVDIVHDIEVDIVSNGVKTEPNQTSAVQNTASEDIKDMDTKKVMEKGLNAGTGLTSDQIGTGSGHKQRTKVHNKLDASSGVSGVCIVPRRRKEFVTGLSKSLDITNSKCEMNIAVRQQYYDKWARAKRGRGSILDYQTKKKHHTNEYEDMGKAMARYKEQRRLKVKQEKNERSPEPETSTYEIVPTKYNINSRESITKLDQDWIPTSSIDIAESLESRFEESGGDLPRVEVQRLISASNNPETENVIESDTYDVLETSSSNGKICQMSQQLLEPFTYDKKVEAEHVLVSKGASSNNNSENSNRREFDGYPIPTLRNSDQASRRSKLQSDTDITINGNVDPFGKKYRLFKLPSKSLWKRETMSFKISAKQTVAEKENIQLDKIPLVLSKKTPVFTDEDNILVDMRNRRLEENLLRIRTRANDSQYFSTGNNFDIRCRSANSTNWPEKQTAFSVTNSLSGKCAQLHENGETLSPVSLTNTVTNQHTSNAVEPSYRANVKNKASISKRLNHSGKWDNVAGPPKLPASVPVPLYLRGESAKTYDHDEKF